MNNNESISFNTINPENRPIEAKLLKEENLGSEEDPIPTQVENNKNWFQRTFGKLGPGSMRASIMNLSILSIGIGTLTIPNKFSKLSIFFCSLVVIISGIATYITLNMVVSAGRKKKLCDYSAVVKEYLGEKAGVFLDVIVVMNLTGINILYQIISKLNQIKSIILYSLYTLNSL